MSREDIAREAAIEKLLASAQSWMKYLGELSGSAAPVDLGNVSTAFAKSISTVAGCLQIMQQQEKEIQLLKAKLDGLESPVVVLDKGMRAKHAKPKF